MHCMHIAYVNAISQVHACAGKRNAKTFKKSSKNWTEHQQFSAMAPRVISHVSSVMSECVTRHKTVLHSYKLLAWTTVVLFGFRKVFVRAFVYFKAVSEWVGVALNLFSLCMYLGMGFFILQILLFFHFSFLPFIENVAFQVSAFFRVFSLSLYFSLFRKSFLECILICSLNMFMVDMIFPVVFSQIYDEKRSNNPHCVE